MKTEEKPGREVSGSDCNCELSNNETGEADSERGTLALHVGLDYTGLLVSAFSRERDSSVNSSRTQQNEESLVCFVWNSNAGLWSVPVLCSEETVTDSR